MHSVRVSTHDLIRQPLAQQSSAQSMALPGIHSRPLLWLGAQSSGGLSLPSGSPTASQLYAPRGLYFDDKRLIVADSGNHRVLIWHTMPTADGQLADVVLGQPNFTSEGAQAGGRGAENGMYLPTAVGVYNEQLWVADAWNHRLLVWAQIPQTSNTPPSFVIGQQDLCQVGENQGGPVQAGTFYWPYSMNFVNNIFYVADTGNRRVLGWHGLPEPGEPATILFGQDGPSLREENRGRDIGPSTYRWPHAIAGNASVLYVADAGNHRVLGWSPVPAVERAADLVLGQPNFTQAQELAYNAQGPQRLRFPYAVALEQELLAVADTANNRILLWNKPPTSGAFHAADAVIGQPDFDSNGENHWQGVTRETLCWPYGIHLHGNRIAIADSGNNRVMIWQIDCGCDEN